MTETATTTTVKKPPTRKDIWEIKLTVDDTEICAVRIKEDSYPEEWKIKNGLKRAILNKYEGIAKQTELCSLVDARKYIIYDPSGRVVVQGGETATTTERLSTINNAPSDQNIKTAIRQIIGKLREQNLETLIEVRQQVIGELLQELNRQLEQRLREYYNELEEEKRELTRIQEEIVSAQGVLHSEIDWSNPEPLVRLRNVGK